MIEIAVPGDKLYRINHLVMDYNGTIAVNGKLLASVRERMDKLRALVHVVVLTADTYGTVTEQCAALGVDVRTFPQDNAAVCKQAVVRELQDGVACLGNGRNDIEMFDAAMLSIAVIEEEGMCAKLLSHADVCVTSAADALDLLLQPDRLRATLRS